MYLTPMPKSIPPRRARVRTASPAAPADARASLLDAAEQGLREHGYAGLSTRKVAEAAGVPLSQIHYHFGSKEALMLALLERQNQRLLERQQAMFASDLPLWKRWELACDYLDDDLASGYVRVLQEMIALGWSNAEVALAVREALKGWYTLLTGMAGEASVAFGGLADFTPEDVAILVGNVFLGAESLLLLDFEHDGFPLRAVLRRVGVAIRKLEETGPAKDGARPRPRKR
jgi:AcrR family transcriptional regulator